MNKFWRRQIAPQLLERRGFILITSYLVVAVLLVLQSAYFSRITQDYQLASRHVQTSQAMHYAEAALDQAIGSLRLNSAYTGTNGATVPLGNGAYSIAVASYPGDTTLRRITAQGYSLNTSTYAATTIPKTVHAILKVTSSLFNWGVFGISSVEGSGNATVNGYTSANNGVYGGGNILTNVASMGTSATAAGSVTLTGNVNVGTGSLACGTGCAPTTAILTGSNVVYGSKTALTQPQSFAVVSAPPPPQGYVIGPVNLSSGAVVMLSPTHPAVFLAPNGRYAYVISSLSVSGNAQLLVASTSPPIDVYVQGAVSLSGNAVVGNQTIGGAASQMTLYETSNSDVKITGNAVVTGTIYAPLSEVEITGNGTDYGAVVANEVELKGNAAIHFDTSLGGGSGSSSNVKLVEWNL